MGKREERGKGMGKNWRRRETRGSSVRVTVVVGTLAGATPLRVRVGSGEVIPDQIPSWCR